MEQHTYGKESVIKLLYQHGETFKQLGVNKLGLFGSFVRSEQTLVSDIDLLVDFLPEQETFRNLMNLHSYLSNLLDRNIEIVTTNSLSPYIGPHILEEVEYVSFAN